MSRFRVANQDATEWLSQLPDESVDLCITDPAYESLEKHRAKGTTTRLKVSKASSNAWFPIFKNERFPSLFEQIYRVLKPDSHCYVMCDHVTMRVIVPMAEKVGFEFWKPIVWDKKTIGLGYHYRCKYELILFFEKGKRKLADMSIPDVLPFPRVRGKYPTQKPVDLLRVFVTQSSSPGEIVIDPFCGSGATGVAAVTEGRHFWGSDIEGGAAILSAQNMTEAGGTLSDHPAPPRIPTDLFR